MKIYTESLNVPTWLWVFTSTQLSMERNKHAWNATTEWATPELLYEEQFEATLPQDGSVLLVRKHRLGDSPAMSALLAAFKTLRPRVHVISAFVTYETEPLAAEFVTTVFNRVENSFTDAVREYHNLRQQLSDLKRTAGALVDDVAMLASQIDDNVMPPLLPTEFYKQ